MPGSCRPAVRGEQIAAVDPAVLVGPDSTGSRARLGDAAILGATRGRRRDFGARAVMLTSPLDHLRRLRVATRDIWTDRQETAGALGVSVPAPGVRKAADGDGCSAP